MDLDDYYAEQDKRMNLPPETIEEYRQRLQSLKRESAEQKAGLHATTHDIPRGTSETRDFHENLSISHRRVTRKMSGHQIESASKRQKTSNNSESIDNGDLVFQSLSASESKLTPTFSANEYDIVEAKPCGETSRSQRDQEPYSLRDDYIQQASPEGEIRSHPSEGSTSSKYGRHTPAHTSLYANEGSLDEIDSFTQGSSTQNHPAVARRALPEISLIGTFSAEPRRGKRLQLSAQPRLELHPVVFEKKYKEHVSDPPTSPIEDPSFVGPTVPPQFKPENSNSIVCVAKHTVKRNEKPVKRAAEGSVIQDQKVAPRASKGSALGRLPSPQQEPIENKATGSKTRKTTDKPAKKITTKKSTKKAKLPLMTPVEYVQMLQAEAARTNNDDEEQKKENQKRRKAVKFLRGKNIFYTGGDMTYATEATRGRMDIIFRVGGNLMPEFDPRVTTHIVTDTNVMATLRALGLKNLKDIPDNIPTVRWSWVLSVLGNESRLEQDEIERRLSESWKYAAFSERMDAGCQRQKTVSLAMLRDRKLKTGNIGVSFTENEDNAASVAGGSEVPPMMAPPLAPENSKLSEDDPFHAFYSQAKEEHTQAHGWMGSSDAENSDADEVPPMKPVKRGWTCDTKEPRTPASCPNQDIIDKLTELMELHQAKMGAEDRWRTFTYNKCIRTLRQYPKRIKTFMEARNIRGIGERTARKIEEIIKTGDLRRIKYEKTEDVVVTRLFQGIYGVGQVTAMQWWSAGCRTLEDLREGKCGVKLNPAQQIGLRYYDDINTRMSREEAKAIFDIIKGIALEIDPVLFVEIMGSYRRGKSTCGDIDILISRRTDDGQTHGGVLSLLLKKLHAAGIITEDLATPDEPDDLEAIYRGLCMLPNTPNAKRRRIDFLCVPWKSRGAAQIYYTGDDIFNRAMRLKANVMGYSLNQRGLFGSVVRDPRDKRVKLDDGVLVASETEEEIFKILKVPWQEPHERVRG